MVPIAGLFEAHLTVADLDRSIGFYRDALGLTLAHTVPARSAAFFWVGGPDHSMLGLWPIGSSPMRLRLHVAFTVALDDVIASVAALQAVGIVPRGGGGAPAREPVVIPWMPAASVFFDDPDGHGLEFLAMLPDQPRPGLAWMPLSQWRARES